jgi:Domain of unknown function (DUF1924)
MKKISHLLIALTGIISLCAQAGSNNISDQFAAQFGVAKRLHTKYSLQAKELNPKATLSAEAGRAFYNKKVTVGGKDLSCSSCHTDNPMNKGTHIISGKTIEPLAISANPDRFTNESKVETNFSNHCVDLYGKNCSAQDKGDFLAYLMSIK